MSTRGRLVLIAAVVVIAVVAFVIAQPGGDDGNDTKSTQATGATGTTGAGKPALPPPVRIVVRGAKPVGGIKKITVQKGDRVRFTVTSDVADEVHVHGYDFMKDVPAGGTVRFDFPARIDGSFEVELEQRAEQIASLRVEP
jgi:hypothetical protein